MPTLLLLAGVLSVSQQGAVTAPTAADTVWVRGLLEAAETELQAVLSGAPQATVGRLARAWVEWGEPQRGAALIAGASTGDPSGPLVLQEAFYREWLNLAIEQYMSGDTAAARRGEAALTGESRDEFRMELAGQLLRSGRVQEADSVLGLIDDPLRRARAVVAGTRGSGANFLSRDDMVERLQDQLVRIQGRSDGEGPNVHLYIHGRLLDLGLELTPADVATLTPEQAQRNLELLADQLQRRGRREEATRFLDSALVIAETRSDMRPPSRLRSRIAILKARNGPGDSARVDLLADSLLIVAPLRPARTPPTPPELEAWYEALRRAREEDDFLAYRQRLVAMDQAGYPQEALWQAVHTGYELLHGRYNPQTDTRAPPRPNELGDLLTTAWSLGADLGPAARDSARVHLIEPSWRALESDSALAKAHGIETRRFRERALAGFVARMEVQEAARLIADFEDVAATNRGFSHLARHYLRAGLVDLAQAAAERTISGDARVWVLALVADARWAMNDTSSARELIRAAVDAMADEALCEGHCEIIGGPGRAPPPESTPSSLLTPVVATAYAAGETAALETWAATRSDSAARARSYIKIAEVVRSMGSQFDKRGWGFWGLITPRSE